MGIGGQHSVKGADASSLSFINHIDRDQYLWGFPVFEHSVSKFGVVGSLHLADSVEHYFIIDDVVTEIGALHDRAVITDIAANDS